MTTLEAYIKKEVTMEYFIISGTLIILRIVKEIAKSKRISQFKKIDISKIEAIGNYEKKSKEKNCDIASWVKKRNDKNQL